MFVISRVIENPKIASTKVKGAVELSCVPHEDSR